MIKKPLLKMEKPPSRRSEEEGVELRAYPDPANNIDEDDVDIDTYTAPVVINNVKDLSDDSDSENIKTQNGVVHDTTDALNDFLNDGDEDLTVKSVHQDYESF